MNDIASHMCDNIDMLANEKQHKSFMALFRNGRELQYKKGEFIIRANETPTGVFLIREGLVKAYKITKYGEENLLIIRKEEEMFPIIWAVTGQERNVIYEAMNSVKLLKISRSEFIEYLYENKEATMPFIDMIIEMYRVHSERLINLEYRSVRERLISFLITVANRFGEKKDNSITIIAPLRRQDIASSINASRETTGREITILERNGLIKTKNSIITLTDVKKLKSLL